LFIFFNILLVPLLLRLERVEGGSGRQLFGGIAHGLPVFLLPCALRFRSYTTLIVNGGKLELWFEFGSKSRYTFATSVVDWILILFADFWVKIAIILGDLATKTLFPCSKIIFFKFNDIFGYKKITKIFSPPLLVLCSNRNG
jgi:hypothetical protein